MNRPIPWSALGSLAILMVVLASPAGAANAPGSAALNLLKPLLLSKTTDLDFGSMFVPATGTGTVKVDPNGAATVYTGIAPAGASGTSRAVFTGSATRLSLVFIQLPAGSVTLTRVGSLTDTIAASNFTIDGAGVLRLVGTTAYTIGVGATLSVPSTTVQGSYVGSFTITANYSKPRLFASSGHTPGTADQSEWLSDGVNPRFTKLTRLSQPRRQAPQAWVRYPVNAALAAFVQQILPSRRLFSTA